MGAGSNRSTNPVDSRWWYWIAAYPLFLLVFVPLIVFVVALVVIPAVILIEVEPGASGLIVVPLVLGGVLFLGIAVGFLVVFLVLPVALYADAKEIRAANVDWDPDPVLYGLVAALQWLFSPFIGLVIALYYLYRRHQVLGVP